MHIGLIINKTPSFVKLHKGPNFLKITQQPPTYQNAKIQRQSSEGGVGYPYLEVRAQTG